MKLVRHTNQLVDDGLAGLVELGEVDPVGGDPYWLGLWSDRGRERPVTRNRGRASATRGCCG
jgi:hypothetical protein